jgi:hypothetical protein
VCLAREGADSIALDICASVSDDVLYHPATSEELAETVRAHAPFPGRAQHRPPRQSSLHRDCQMTALPNPFMGYIAQLRVAPRLLMSLLPVD